MAKKKVTDDIDYINQIPRLMDLAMLPESDTLFKEDQSIVEELEKMRTADHKYLYKYLTDLVENNGWQSFDMTILGDSKAWSRAVKLKTHVYDPNSGTKAVVASAIIDNFGKDFKIAHGDVFVDIIVYKPMNKNTPVYKSFLMEHGIIRVTKTPDVDNYAKLLMDTMNNVLFGDDAQVSYLIVEKYYSKKPRMVVNIKYRPHAY